jgi:hypothetical protein
MHTHSTHLSQNNTGLFEKACRLLSAQHSLDDIREKLIKENNASEEEVEHIIKQLKKIQHEKDHKIGRALVLIGAVLLLAGFVFTFLNIYANQPVHFAMYGLTSAGLAVLFVGLYFVFN